MSESNIKMDNLVDEAEQLAAKGLMDEARSRIQTLIGQISDPILLCRIGRIATRIGDWEEGERALLSAISLAPKLSVSYEVLGLLYLKRDEVDDLEKAQHYLISSIEIEETVHGHTLLGVVQQRLGRLAEARTNFNKALQLNPSYDEAYFNLGLTFRQEEPSKAIELFGKAIELDPNFAAVHRELGDLLRRLGQYGEAENHLRKAIELNESDGWSYMYMGHLMWVIGELNSAEEAFKMAINIWPEDSLTHWCLAFYYEYQGKVEEAASLYKKALQLDPDDSEANLRFGLFLRDLGETERAKTHIRRALVSDPQSTYARLLLAELESLDDSDG